MSKRADIIAWALIASLGTAGVLFVLAFAYIRIFVITANPFDGFRERSVDCLWASCLCFLTMSAVAAAAAGMKERK